VYHRTGLALRCESGVKVYRSCLAVPMSLVGMEVLDDVHSGGFQAPVGRQRFLREILAVGGHARLPITAYAIGMKRTELGSKMLASYEKTKLDEDLALSPAA
jgi:hypothetical protein